MEQNKKTRNIIAVAILTLVLGASGILAAHAATTPAATKDNFASALAARFNLNENDVKAFLQEQRSQQQKQHEQMFSDRLAKAVTEGKLTQAQADAITAKKAEVESFHKSLEGKSKAEVDAAIKAHHDAMLKWAEENKIADEFMFFGNPMMSKGGIKGPGHMFRGAHRNK